MRTNMMILLLLVFVLNPVLVPVPATEFVFNGFDPSQGLLLYGNVSIELATRSLSLTQNTPFSMGRALYPTTIPSKSQQTKQVLPFSTSFILSMSPYPNTLPGHGIVFLFTPQPGLASSTSSNFLGLLNFTNNGQPANHLFGIEFDVFQNQEYGDINDNHVGIDVNSLSSLNASEAGYYPDDTPAPPHFKPLRLNSGHNYQVWIDYSDALINVTMAPAGTNRPLRPLLNIPIDLSRVFLNEMFVGFTASTGRLVENHRILAWSFSNTNFTFSDQLVTTGLPSFVLSARHAILSRGLVAVVMTSSFLLLTIFVAAWTWCIRRRKERERKMEEWELEYWPHRISYREIDLATKGFRKENVIGTGGNGNVYRGVVSGGAEVAVKCISRENEGGMQEFVSEISSLGRLKHRNLVGLRGWCKRADGNFMLVYDYLENGSLDKWLFGTVESKTLRFKERVRVLRDVAHGVLYLHDGWEARVLHRDIKSSNVLLDKDMNAKLGDFGLARIHTRGEIASTTRVIGTVGYLAPEVVRTGRASVETDVFGFGVLVLEVMCGRRAIEDEKAPLMEWAWGLMAEGKLASALDQRLRKTGNFDREEAERILHLGLLCGYPDPGTRPTMRQVVKALEENGRELESMEFESEEDMSVYLLDKLKTRQLWEKYSSDMGSGTKHPNLREIQQPIMSSITINWSDVLTDGR